MQSYSELRGAEGREIRFRSQRFRAKDLLAKVPPHVIIGNQSYAVHDLSMSGLAIQAVEPGPIGDVGRTVDLALGVDGAVVYSGRGEIARRQPDKRGTRIGIRIVNGYLDISGLVAEHDRIAARQELDEAPAEHALYVTPEYRRVCADLVYMLRRYRSLLDRHERHAGESPEARRRFEDIFAMCAERFPAEWRALLREGHAAVTPLLADRRAVAAGKRFTEAVVTPELVAGPIWRRSYEKPRGYPGDFEIMNYVYDGGDRGDSAYARLCHRIGLEVGGCVGTRMAMIADSIAERLARPGEELAVTSLGSGSAREVVRALRAAEPRRGAAFTLIDQDNAALAAAYDAIYPFAAASADAIRVACLHLSFTQLLGRPDLIQTFPPQDLIYCAGLVDYLPTPQAKLLVGGLFHKLKPGGTLIVGNMRAGTDNVWSLGFILDWELIYRDEAAMADLAEFARPATMELKVDPTGYNYMLYLDKR
jgi:hypothetical protein